jgi:hypothetical protein
MITKILYIIIISLLFSGSGYAQILGKLKETARQAAERAILKKTDEKVTEATEIIIDDVSGGDKSGENPVGKNKPVAFANPSKEINSEAKRAFYTHDVLIKTFDKEKQSYTTTYFDSDELAMRSDWKDANTGEAKTMYIDSEGFYISYNESKGRYEKSNLLSSGVMSMMAPTIMISAYKLPAGPFWDTSQMLDEQGIKLNTFLYVEFAFIYNPEHFRQEMYNSGYTESQVGCRGNQGCTRFSINDPAYAGSYILFNSSNRLAEINVRLKDDPSFGSGEGKLEFFYEPCEVYLPSATEVKQPFQDLLMKGLDSNKR